MSSVVTCWSLPQLTNGFHVFDRPGGFPVADSSSDPARSSPDRKGPSSVRLPCAGEGISVCSSRKCSLVEIRPQALRSDTDVASAPLSAAHVLVSHAFTLTGFIPPILTPLSSRLCALAVVLSCEDLERLGNLLLRLEDGIPSDVLRYFSIASTTAVAPFPPGLTYRLTHLITLVLRNIVPTWNRVSASHTTTPAPAAFRNRAIDL